MLDEIFGAIEFLLFGTKRAMTRNFELQKKRFNQRDGAWLAGLAILVVVSASPVVPSFAQPYQGFGANTVGGVTDYHVTTLNDSGVEGSLRHALSQGNRHITFGGLAGEILLNSNLVVRGAHITIDGFTADDPGITLRNFGLNISGTRGANNVIVRGIRIRGAGNSTDSQTTDGISIIEGAYNVVVDRVSIDGSEDGNLDIGTNAHDVTVQWSILSGVKNNMLIKFDPSRVTLHHNLFLNTTQRNPQVAIDNARTPATDTTVDMRNNLVWDWGGGSGTVIRDGAWANVVDNFYGADGGDKQEALQVTKGGRAYTIGNLSAEGVNLDVRGTETIPFPAPIVDTTDACTAAHDVLAGAGVSPLDTVDEQNLSEISIPDCESRPAITSPAPGSVLPGAQVTFSWAANGATVKNWRLYVGSGRGASDLHDSNRLNPGRTSRVVQHLPTDGRTIWVQLRFDVDGLWQYKDFQYIAAAQ